MSEDADGSNPKPEHLDRLSSLWRRIYDRKIAQWSVAYVALAYGIQHGVVLTREAYEWPHVIEQISMLLLTLGLPVVMTFAWYHGERASRRISGPELTIIAILLAIGSMFFYVLVRPGEETAASRAPATQQAGLPAARQAAADPNAGISIAVLPFENLSGDASQEFFSDGMTEEITAALAKVADLKVVARTSAFQFKTQGRDVQSIGRELHATHFIEGSVRKEGNRVRITAQLIRADDGTHIWTESYDRELTGVFAIQEDIARAITASLRMPLGLKPGENLVNNRAIDSESYQQYLRAKSLMGARGRQRIAEAGAILEDVVARNPDYAPAWALLGFSYFLRPNTIPERTVGPVESYRKIVDTFLAKATTAANRAVQLDPNLAYGYLVLGEAEGVRGHPLRGMLMSQSKVFALDPDNGDALHGYALSLAWVGHVKEAIAVRQRLMELEPTASNYNIRAALALWLDGQNDAAIRILKDLPSGQSDALAVIYASLGRYSDAIAVLEQMASDRYPAGTREEAIRLLRLAPAKVASAQSLPALGLLSWVYLYVGAPERVLEIYERGIEGGYVAGFGNPESVWHPAYAPLRKTERFKAFARKAGLVEYWLAKGWPPQCHPTSGDDFVCE